MPTYFARKAGNINATDVWATAPAGTASAVTFVAGDVLMANSFAITVNVSTDLGGAGQVRNDATGGATAGGSFTLSNGVTLTANVFTGSGSCVSFLGVSPNSATIVGNLVAGSIGAGSHGASNSSTGTLNITGNCTGASSNSGVGAANSSTGTLNITGNCTGGAWSTSFGASNSSTGTLNITGNCSAAAGGGVNNASTGILSIIGTVTASATAPGVAGANVQQVTILSGPFITETSRGVAPVYCAAWRWNASPSNSTYMEVMTNNLLAKRNLVTDDNVTGMPSVSNVRSGTIYGPTSALTGTLVVPAASSVAFGTPVDNTTGTAVLTPANVQSALTAQGLTTARAGNLDNLDTTVSSRLAPSGTLAVVTTLTNAPTVPSAAAIADEVRVELATELARLDAPVSGATAPSAATVASQVRTELTAELAKVAALNTERLANVATTAIVGNLIAQANS